MPADVLLAKLDKIRRVGDGRWVALCPAHEDKTPSLSVRELEDGTVLVHDFGGCAVGDVLGAVGLDFEALFPEKPPNGDRRPRERRPWSDRQLLEIIDRETTVIFIAACDVTLEGRELSEVDISRLRKARERITAVMGTLT